MITQTSLSEQHEQIIYTLIKSGRFTVTNRIGCHGIKRCDDCPLGEGCVAMREAYALKHHPELFI